MDITLDKEAGTDAILAAIKQCGGTDAVCCTDEGTFKRAKLALVQEKLEGVTIQLLDSDGYAVRQVTSKRRSEASTNDQLTDRQRNVIKALEKVLKHCYKEGIQLVGYSDELVALPSHVPLEEIANASAVEVESFSVYKGADAILPESHI